MRLTIDLVTDFESLACWLMATRLSEVVARLPSEIRVRIRWLPFWEAGAETPAVLNAHRLMRLAAERAGSACVARLGRALFAARFIDERELADDRQLAGIAVHAGLDAPAVDALLAGEDKVDEVRAYQTRLIAAGVTQAPIVKIGGQVLAGVVDDAVLDEILAGALAQLEAEARGTAPT
jgi:predicted DsbA family dithiol-disulfide isomerase